MDRGQIALKLFLDELGVPPEVGTIDDRKRVQKAVYLGQLSGVDLGYRFGWYIMGPYCPSLTRDYFPLAEALAAGDSDWEGKTLKPNVKSRLAKIRPILHPSAGITMNPEDWLELVASLHFLKTVSNMADDEITATLKKKKPHVYPFLEEGKKALKTNGLWPEE